MPQRFPLILILAVFAARVWASDTLFTYQDFSEDLDVLSVNAHDQSRIWSTCAVVHDFVAMMDENGASSSSAEESMNQGRGAKLASGVVFMADYFETSDAPDPSAFGSKWDMAKLVMENNYVTVQTSVFAALEASPETTIERIVPTYAYCLKILPAQQMYIDLWREMYGSGLLVPKE